MPEGYDITKQHYQPVASNKAQGVRARFADKNISSGPNDISYMNLLRVGVRNTCPNDLGRVSMVSNTSGPTYAQGEPRALIGKCRPRLTFEPNRHISKMTSNKVEEVKLPEHGRDHPEIDVSR